MLVTDTTAGMKSFPESSADVVLEAVFIALLAGEHVSQGTIIAALLAYRMLYYFLPLALATVCYLVLESRAKKLRAKNEKAMAK